MQSRVESIEVDEAWYLDRYSDIEPAISHGLISTPAEHYVLFGFYEHRMPYRILVDESWYFEHNADVREAVATGVFPSAQAHFDELGFREGRFPYPDFGLRTRVRERMNVDA